MITDKHSQTLIFWCQRSNSRSPTSISEQTILRILCWYSSIEQSDLSSLNSLNKNEHYKSASKKKQKKIQYGHHNPTKKHSETSLMAKVPSKINNFEGLEKVCHKFFPDFPLEETQHASPNLDRERSAKYRYSSNMAEHDSSQISSLTILDQATKGQIPTLNLPSLQNIFLISIFFQIWRFRSDDSFP